MTVTISKAAINLREELASRPAPETHPQEAHWYSGDGTKTSFALPTGWRPKFVYVGGLLKRPGPGEDYEPAYDGFIWTVTFAVAPPSGDVAIVAERVLA